MLYLTLPAILNRGLGYTFKLGRIEFRQWLKWSCQARGSLDEARLEQTLYPFHTQPICRYFGHKITFCRFNQGGSCYCMGLKSEQGLSPLARHFNYSVQLLKIKIISEFIGTWALTSKVCNGRRYWQGCHFSQHFVSFTRTTVVVGLLRHSWRCRWTVNGERRGRKSKFSRTASFCNANDTNDFATLLVFVIYQVVLPWTDAGFF